MLAFHRIPGTCLVWGLWIKVGFILLQPWLYLLFAFLAALLAEGQVPAVLTRR